jgi:uncharacterized protein (DUF1778 family)
MTNTTHKTTRFEVRVSAEEKETVEYAASLEGTTVSAYMRSRVLQAAKEDISLREKMILSNHDRDIFLKALEDPSEPCDRLKAAFSEFRNKYQVS